MRCTYSRVAPEGPLGIALAAVRLEVDEPRLAALTALGERYLSHRFDLLGSGWTNVKPGLACKGLEGIRFPPSEVPARPEQRVNRPNASYAAQVFELIEAPDYVPIDWQLDFRSGFRFSERAYFTDLAIGSVRGADIKLPWELGRMQHLPRLALLASLVRDDAATARYTAEIRSQILDFIASNPPRFGAGWGCPMDVGIRAANWCLAYALAARAGTIWDAAFETALACSLVDHAEHILANLEWSETGRSNHYLSDIAGLAFIAATLPASDRADAWLAFALSEVGTECVLQFHEDGGNYEGSTAYHRLSLELVAFPAALALGLNQGRKAGLSAARREPLNGVRVPVPADFGARARELAEGRAADFNARLAAAGDFLAAATRPDGELHMVGDVDSGRLFKLEPTLRGSLDALDESTLRGREMAAATARLWSDGSTGRALSLEAMVMDALRGDGRLILEQARAGAAPQLAKTMDYQTLPGIRESRRLEIPLPRVAPGALQFEAYPDFGLYVWRADGLYVAFRCSSHAREDAPYGHTHDDNLAVEVWQGGAPVIQDPGTYVYTSLPELRKAYREWPVHLVPRTPDWEAIEWDPDYLFNCRHVAVGECLFANETGALGLLKHPEGQVGRQLRFEAGVLELVDFSVDCALNPDPGQPVPVSLGYGRRAEQPLTFPAFA